MLDRGDFAPFLNEIYGYEPFPWQMRLLQYIMDHHGEWPAVLNLPTGSGKTAAIDIAVFHLALEAGRRETRRAPVRIAFVVDRRLVVDDAFERAKKIADVLAHPPGPISTRVAERLHALAGDGLPLVAQRLRGGIPREDDWARTPAQPTVLCSTVDQVGSRLLFRGYGVSDSMKPVHAGLLGSDCLILLDEAHLAEPFRQTLEWIRTYQGQNWRGVNTAAPWGVAVLTATPGEYAQESFALTSEDRTHPVLKRRLNASKPARLVRPAQSGRKSDDEADNDGLDAKDEERESSVKDIARRTNAIVREVENALEHFDNAERGAAAPAIGVIVNRVARARAVFERLKEKFKDRIETGALGEPILMIGPARPADRDELAGSLRAIRTRVWAGGEKRVLDRPLVIVATQCIEAGVDIDLDALITELAPLDALCQRFGRLNRAGRDVDPDAAIVTMKSDISSRQDDPIYGTTLKAAWEVLEEAHKHGDGKGVEFGRGAFAVYMRADALAPKADAPVLLPAHLDLLSQTSPIPAADPDLALYLHGPKRQPDSITVVWRADVDPEMYQDEEARHEQTRRLLMLVPPRPAEGIELPVWAVRRWLQQRDNTLDQLADVAGAEPSEGRPHADIGRRQVFRWKGDDERSRWIAPADLHPGDTIVAPAAYGGLDRFGWNPKSKREESGTEGIIEERVTDVGQKAAAPFAGRRFAVRVAPGLLGSCVSDGMLAEALAGAASRKWRNLQSVVLGLPLPEPVRRDVESLNRARGNVVAYLDLYGFDEAGRPRGIVFVALRGIEEEVTREESAPSTTEDDAAGSIPGFPLKLEPHGEDVGAKAGMFARAAGLSEARIADLECAGYLHDIGKADPRFQAWLHYGDPLGPDLDHLLAKSGRRLPRAARADSGLPEQWRHEALSVRLAPKHARFADAEDPELVLWLVGAHHGYGRPLFPHCDPMERTPEVGPQSLAFDWCGLDWASLFTRLKARYGVWELARLEAILRLADHRASESEATALEDESR